jgi:hypothetical protein
VIRFVAGLVVGAVVVAAVHAAIVEEALGVVAARRRELEERVSGG